MKLALPIIWVGLAGVIAAFALKPFAGYERGTVALMADEAVEVGDRTLLLRNFTVEKYPSGKPSQFRSEAFLIGGERMVPAVISVNHPLRYRDYWIYQTAYNAENEAVTELTVVRDRWLPLAAIGALLMVLGAFVNCFGFKLPMQPAGRKKRLVNLLGALVVIALPVFIVGRAMLRPEPMPALQSPFLYPHVGAYIASYLIFILAAFGLCRRYLSVGFLLMTLGLVLGGAWGKFCWGDYWQNDPKEVASLVTWFAYFAYFHLCRFPKAEVTLRIIGAILVILTLTVVNFTRIFVGLHSYA